MDVIFRNKFDRLIDNIITSTNLLITLAKAMLRHCTEGPIHILYIEVHAKVLDQMHNIINGVAIARKIT